MSQLLQKAPGVTVIVREEGVIQLGLDALRAGVISLADVAAAPVANSVARILQEARQPLSELELNDQLTAAGLSQRAAQSLVQDLVKFGAWRPSDDPRSIVVWGLSPLAQRIVGALKEDGFRVLQPESAPADLDSPPAQSQGPEAQRNATLDKWGHLLRAHTDGQSDAAEAAGRLVDPYELLPLDTRSYVECLDTNIPLILVDVLAQAHALSVALTKRPRTWLPVTSLDTRVLVGPLHRAGTGPCPLCLNLYRAELDPLWPRVIRGVPAGQVELDSQVAAAAVARVVIASRHLTGRLGLPGATPVRWLPGETLEVDVCGHDQRRAYEPHPRCPVCFTAAAPSKSS